MKYRSLALAGILALEACHSNAPYVRYQDPQSDPTGFYKRQPLTNEDLLFTYADLQRDPRTRDQTAKIYSPEQRAYMDALIANLGLQNLMMERQMDREDDEDLRNAFADFSATLQGAAQNNRDFTAWLQNYHLDMSPVQAVQRVELQHMRNQEWLGKK